MTASVEVLGQRVALPVEVRVARSAAATFLVRHAAAAALLDGTGLAPARLPGGRALCILAMVDYADNDLGQYGEVAMCIGVAKHDGVPPGAYIHQLPVDGEFTRAAGREIWGFPKWMADIDLDIGPRGARGRLSEGDELVLELEIGRRWLPLPSKPAEMSAYANLDGTTRRTPFTSRATEVRGGPLGAKLTVGTRHPMALELRSLGLPKRAVMSTIIGNMAATFGAATEL